MTEIKTTKIPHLQRCINKEHPFATGAKDIYDDALEKNQAEINADIIAKLEALEGNT
jgi:hypothetical protein